MAVDPGKVPESGRTIFWCDPVTGLMHEWSIVQFIILQSISHLRFSHGIADPTPDQVSDVSADVAGALVMHGWFTEDEYVDTWIQEEMEDLDEELQALGESSS